MPHPACAAPSNALRRAVAAIAIAAAAGGASAQSLPVQILLEAEPNATRGQAQTVPLGEYGSIVTGALKRPGDVDLYRLKLPIGTCVLNAMLPNLLADYDLELLSALGIVLARSENRGAGQVEILPICGLPLSTTYYLRVTYASGTTGPITGSYAIGIGGDELLTLLPPLLP